MKRYAVTRDTINKEATLKTLQGATREYHEKQGHACYFFENWCEEAHYTFTRCMNDNTVVPYLKEVNGEWKEDKDNLGNLINVSHGNYYICLSNVKTLEIYYFLFDTIDETEIAWDYYVAHSRQVYKGMLIL